MLAHAHPGLDRQVKRVILHTAQGNLLALNELPQALTLDQQRATASLPEVLPLGPRLHRLHTPAVARLPGPTRALLLTAALDGTGDLHLLHAAAADRYRLQDLAPAERAGLAAVDTRTRRLAFPHPLLRCAAVAAAPVRHRRRAHAALAAALTGEPQRCARHLAAAGSGPDATAAALLHDAAMHSRRNGDHVTTLSLLLQAAEHDPAPHSSHRHLTEAAFLRADTEDAGRTTAALLATVRSAGGHHAAPLLYAAATALTMVENGDPIASAHALLLRALHEHTPTDSGDPDVADALWTLLSLSATGGTTDLWTGLRDLTTRLTGAPALLGLTVDLLADPVRTAAGALPALPGALAAAHSEVDSTRIQHTALSALYTDRLTDLREPLWRSVTEGRAGGPARRHLVALMNLCLDDFHRGHWREQAELAAEGIQLAADLGDHTYAWCFDYHQALLAAVQGRFQTSRLLTDRVSAWARERGSATVHAFARHASGLARLGQGDWEGAYQDATAVTPAGRLLPHVPHALWMALDLVEAAVRAGRTEQAAAHAAALRDARIRNLSPRLALHVAAVDAITAPGNDAGPRFEAALALPTAEEWPFDTARIRLSWGEHLRRSRTGTDARIPLQHALTAFEELGATPWAQRAERELRAAGRTTRTADAPGTSTLTAQEAQVAQLAAQGLTNKQIAEHLTLSPRTVSSHLYRVFPKLGITTRAALRDAIGNTLP